MNNVDNNEHHPALLGRFLIVALSINVQSYLLTYLLKELNIDRYDIK